MFQPTSWRMGLVGLTKAENSPPISLNKAVHANPHQALWEEHKSLAQGFAQCLPAGHREVEIGLSTSVSMAFSEKCKREREGSWQTSETIL